ncbi:hypothetical protein [Reyranella sp.]|uniref:hypothetical protein n=1 Tax=Reyranella sp. TaxID=1929291 RepID=UPI003D0BAC71
MTIARFQSSLAKLVAHGGAIDDNQGALSDLEKQRLADIGGQHGKAIMQTLYFGWRLTKVLSLLPLTTRLLGDEALAASLKGFWKQRMAKSLYFVEECLAFLDFLEGDIKDRPAFFEEVTGFEKARLQLRDRQSKGRPCQPVEVRFRCHPDALLSALMSGTDVSTIVPDDIVLRGELGEDGEERWTLLQSAAEELRA